MTQLSSSTSIFDQVATSLSDLIVKLKNGRYITKRDLVIEFNKALSDAYQKIDSFNTEISLFYKGEPPTSSKMNKFIDTMRNDINISAKQLDYLTAKAISVFNLFTTEIENEKKYAQRIFSKSKILQMYSQSSSSDLIYVGDSFDNQDFIDVSKMKINENPLIANGYMTIQPTTTVTWNASSISIKKSNGFLGNNHSAIKKRDQVNNENYTYEFKNGSSFSNIRNIVDKNPLTFFEYEALNVDKTKYTVNGLQEFSENEFSYIVDIDGLSEAPKRSLVNWANHNMQTPLVLSITLSTQNPQKANSVKIIPYFGFSKIVKIKEIYVTNDLGESEKIINEPFFIGISPESFNQNNFSKYYFDSATIKFSERKVQKIEIVFEQPYFYDQEILHSYWITDYKTSNSDNSPFFGSVKFNPDILSQDIYSEINYNKDEIIPPLSNPNVFKKTDVLNKKITVTLRKKPQSSSTSGTLETFSVPIKIKNDVLPAKRMAIGIRDITVEYVLYADSAEIVSLPFNFDSSVESLMLNVETNSNNFINSRDQVSTSISLDGKNWIAIAPSQTAFGQSSSNALPEILVFNQNVASGYKLPGVSYLNHPQIPKDVKEISVKIALSKNKITNEVPIVYSYTLATKVKLS